MNRVFLLVVLVGLLGAAEIVVLGLYTQAIERLTEAQVRLEFTNGARLIAEQALRQCRTR